MVSKIVEVAFFCNVIIFYCFLELLETAAVFFLKISILGKCYTLVSDLCYWSLVFSSYRSFVVNYLGDVVGKRLWTQARIHTSFSLF